MVATRPGTLADNVLGVLIEVMIRQGPSQHGSSDWGNHTICSKLHAKPFGGLGLLLSQTRVCERSHGGRGIKGISLSKPCCRTRFKGNWFEEAVTEDAIRLSIPDLFPAVALSVQF